MYQAEVGGFSFLEVGVIPATGFKMWAIEPLAG
jgi:hypothetical protein